MAIKVIKHGQKPKFKKTCPNCGCEFEYEVEDLQIVSERPWINTLTYNYPPRKRRMVTCPDCGEQLFHDTIVDPDWYPNYPTVTYTTNTPSITISNWPDCATCPNRPDPNKPATVGDTPCTWCVKNRPYCTTGAVTATSDPNPNGVKITVSGNSQKVDFNNLLAGNATAYSMAEAPKENKKLDLGFSPEDIDLPQ